MEKNEWDLSLLNPCKISLKALAEGRLTEWSGLPPGCSRFEAEAALGPSLPGPDGVGNLEGYPMAFRDYPVTPFAPYGITVWWNHDLIYMIQINEPWLDESKLAALGPPERTVPSGLHMMASQLIYASRGLTVHLTETPARVIRLYGYTSTTVEGFLDSPFSRVQIRRIPRRIL